MSSPEGRPSSGRTVFIKFDSLEGVTASDRLEMYPHNAASMSWFDRESGSLEAGKITDFTVIDCDPLASGPGTFADMAVHRTVVGGRVVHDDGRLDRPNAS
jgi:predicted amidohydrolase YtcJ